MSYRGQAATLKLRALRTWRALRFPGSQYYWEQRYQAGGNSGAGSYGEIAEFKAASLNAFVAEHSVSTVVEFGCGDGHQLSLASYPQYIGLDVSPTAIAKCREQFASDPTKTFQLYEPSDPARRQRPLPRAEMTLSLDVIYHLIEDDIYHAHMRDLFDAAERFVGIFASDSEDIDSGGHVRHRKFTTWISSNATQWELIAQVKNPYLGEDSNANLYFYGKR